MIKEMNAERRVKGRRIKQTHIVWSVRDPNSN